MITDTGYRYMICRMLTSVLFNISKQLVDGVFNLRRKCERVLTDSVFNITWCPFAFITQIVQNRLNCFVIILPKIVLKESSLDSYFTNLTNYLIIISLLQSKVKCSSNKDLKFKSGISVENSKKKIELAIKQYNVSYMSI